MENRIKIAVLSVMCFFLTLAQGSESPRCRNLITKVDFHRKQLDEYQRLSKDLEKKYQRYVAADFEAQAEGILNTLSRNKAIKVVYAKKRLKKAVAETKLSMSTTTSQYCTDCRSEANLPLTRIRYCERCSEETACRQ